MELVTNVERYLTVDKMDEIYQAFLTLNSLLPNIKIPSIDIEDTTVDYATSPVDVPKKLNAVEKNIQALHYAVDGRIDGWTDGYFKKFVWDGTVREKRSEVQRWINWINSFHTMLTNTVIDYKPLYFDENPLYTTGGEPLHYINRKFIAKEN